MSPSVGFTIDESHEEDGVRVVDKVTVTSVRPPPRSLSASDKVLIEALAALEHEQWMFWAKSLMESEPGLSGSRFERWQALMVPYGALSEEMKDYDRDWARRVLEVLDSHG